MAHNWSFLEDFENLVSKLNDAKANNLLRDLQESKFTEHNGPDTYYGVDKGIMDALCDRFEEIAPGGGELRFAYSWKSRATKWLSNLRK